MEIPSENHNTELKQSFDNDAIAKEIVAFLNAYDGKIYIGITKQRKVIGISPDNNKDKLDEIMLKVSNVIADQISPRCVEFVTIKHILLDRKDVIEIDVRKGNQFYYHKKYGMSEKGCFVREGTSAKPLMPEEIKRRYEANLDAREASMRETESSLQRLSFDILKGSLREHGLHVNDDAFLDNYGLLTKDGKYNLIADLFADENDISIKIVRFEGIDKTKLVERTEYGYKSLILSIRRTLDRFEALNVTKSTIKVPQRVDKKLFNMAALREAFINAIAHTKWTEFNPPQIQVFSNRIEIISTGSPVKELSKEEFFKGVSKLRNPELMRILRELEFVEQTGFGVPTILKAYGESAFNFLDNFVMVTIPFDEEVMMSIDNVHENVHENVHDNLEIIIQGISDNPYITLDQLAKLISKSKKTVQRLITSSKKIKRVDGAKGGHWEVLP